MKFPELLSIIELRDLKRLEISRILRFHDSSQGISVPFSPFRVVFDQKRSKRAAFFKFFRGPPGVFVKFTEKCRGVFRKSAQGFPK